MRVLLYAFSTAVVVAALMGGAGFWVWHDLTTPTPLPAGGALVSVTAGEPFRAVAARLQAAGVLRHAETLRWWAQWKRLDRGVRSGDYRFEQPLTPLEVLALLRSSAAALHRVTIPEGSTIDQAAALLAAAGFGGSDEFLCVARNADFLARMDLPASGLEGYAFPDTYAFSWSMSPEQILSAMVQRFREQTGGLQARRRDAGMSERDMVIVGSLIEREAAAANERALVSAVFHNRLRRGMPLQSDPTAVYGRDVRGAPTAADLTVESPYNTYLHTGLPPGPICNPGLAALAAAVSPAAVPYLYFVSRKDGTHAFSSTLDEHNRAVARYLRGGQAAHKTDE